MPLDHYVTLGPIRAAGQPIRPRRDDLRRGPGGAGHQRRGIREESSPTYLDRGGNFIDTANFYTNGHSEKILGDWFAAHPGQRERVVLASKFFTNLYPGDPNGGGAGRSAIIASCTRRCAGCSTDYLDLYWLHNWDRNTPDRGDHAHAGRPGRARARSATSGSPTRPAG